MTDTQITGNNADNNAGAIYNNEGTLTVIDTQFTGNNADNNAGAIYNYYYSNLTVTDTQFTNNNATYGGAIYNNQSTIKEMNNILFYNNTPENFEIEDNHIQLVNNDNYITLSKVT